MLPLSVTAFIVHPPMLQPTDPQSPSQPLPATTPVLRLVSGQAQHRITDHLHDGDAQQTKQPDNDPIDHADADRSDDGPGEAIDRESG